VSEAQTERSRARALRWTEVLWEGANTTAREESRKKEVLWVLRELARDSRNQKEVREYVPSERPWLIQDSVAVSVSRRRTTPEARHESS
jgi:hypothetical protein